MSAKSKIGKEYQGNIFQFFIFLVALVAYLFLYDRSFELFLQDIKYVVNLDFKDHHLLNAIFWIVGFWGMILLLNLKNNYAKSFFWFLLISSAWVNFAYIKIYKTGFEYSSHFECGSIVSQFFHIATIDLVKFFAINIVMIILSFVLKPLSVSLNKTILIALAIVVALSFLVSGGSSVQAIYFVPVVFCYKYLLVFIAWVKTSLK